MGTVHFRTVWLNLIKPYQTVQKPCRTAVDPPTAVRGGPVRYRPYTVPFRTVWWFLVNTGPYPCLIPMGTHHWPLLGHLLDTVGTPSTMDQTVQNGQESMSTAIGPASDWPVVHRRGPPLVGTFLAKRCRTAHVSGTDYAGLTLPDTVGHWSIPYNPWYPGKYLQITSKLFYRTGNMYRR